MKDNDTVIREFNSIVNMTASELKTWLQDPQSGRAGWPKDNNSNNDNGDDDGETVGHDSGRKIVSILEANPSGDPSSYTEEQTRHMRKVVGYCKRHLAQEEAMLRRKSADEVEESKSYISLKNWGHDPLKKSKGGGDQDDAENGENGENGDKQDGEKGGEEEEEEVGDEEEEEAETGGKGAGDKRKKKATTASTQNGGNKRRNTRQSNGAQSKDDEKDDDDHSEEDEDEDEDGAEDNNDQQATNTKEDDGAQEDGNEGDEEEEEEEEETENNGKNTNGNSSGSKAAKKGPKPGDTVSWNWGSGQPKGKVLDVKGEKTTIETKRGNEVSRKGDPQDPAVVLDTGKSKAIKFNHELNETA